MEIEGFIAVGAHTHQAPALQVDTDEVIESDVGSLENTADAEDVVVMSAEFGHKATVENGDSKHPVPGNGCRTSGDGSRKKPTKLNIGNAQWVGMICAISPDSTAMVRATVGIFVCEGRMPPPHDGVICVCPHV